MSNPSFAEPPSVELLQWLARGSLKQNLPRSVRLWVWLRFLYGDEGADSSLPELFTYADWRDAFFTPTHPKGEAIPGAHDPNCRCAQLTVEWLFSSQTGLSRSLWIKALKRHDSSPDKLEDFLQTPLFRVTRRSLYEDLQILAKLGWVQRTDQAYQRVVTFPTHPVPMQTGAGSVFLQADLAAIAANLSQQINGWQRFLLHVDYIVPQTATDQVDDWQAELRQIWEQPVVPPIALTYQSAQLSKRIEGIVYPVCIYYVQRATYLCAWGQTSESEGLQMSWRNYRLDRIVELRSLSWSEARIPKALYQAYQRHQLPTPDYIQEQMAEAWGFDFYQPDELLVLRFDAWFDQSYIQGTVRHETFKPIAYDQVGRLIRQHPALQQSPTEREALLQIWQARSLDDAYYQARYRVGDPNVMLRLRSWRPKIEVLLPWQLRQQVAAEVEREMKLYW